MKLFKKVVGEGELRMGPEEGEERKGKGVRTWERWSTMR